MSNSFIGEVRAFPYGYAPDGWLECMGQALSVGQYQMLFAVIGVTYGGDPRTTFNLPDLRGRAVVGHGGAPGLSSYTIGNLQGSDSVALTSVSQLPAHTHTITSKYMSPKNAPGAHGNTPGPTAYLSRFLDLSTAPPTALTAYRPQTTTALTSLSPNALTTFPSGGQPAQAHENRQPFTTIRYCICVTGGLFPQRQ